MGGGLGGTDSGLAWGCDWSPNPLAADGVAGPLAPAVLVPSSLAQDLPTGVLPAWPFGRLGFVIPACGLGAAALSHGTVLRLSPPGALQEKPEPRGLSLVKAEPKGS